MANDIKKEVAMMKTKPEEINNKTKGKLNKSKANTKDKVKVRSLGRKIVVTVSVFLMLVVAISTYFSVRNAREALYSQLDAQAKQIADILIYNLKNLSNVERDVDQIIDIYIENLGHFIKIKGNYTNEELRP
ncbi:MAG: hypothetical protein GXY88_04395 [Tissierellia bacterium]|nr:hypothetical protein [Tissierellia bacterium]